MAMVLACMALGVCLGAGMAFVCHKQEFMNVPWLQHMVEVVLMSYVWVIYG